MRQATKAEMRAHPGTALAGAPHSGPGQPLAKVRPFRSQDVRNAFAEGMAHPKTGYPNCFSGRNEGRRLEVS